MNAMLEGELGSRSPKMPNLWSMVKAPEEFWGDMTTHTRRLLKELLEGTMEVWRDEWVEAEWHEVNDERRDYRNGYYDRKHWPTPLGPLGKVRVPRCRQGGLTKTLFDRLQTKGQVMADAAVDMLLAGVSTRRVGELLDQIIDLPVSAGQVSRLAKKLDAEVRKFHQRPLADEFVYLLLDGIHLKSRGVPRLMENGLRRSKKRVILVAYGITPEGIKQLIDFRVANSESETAWRQFLWQLYKRGLQGNALKLITTDGNPGLIGAVEEVYHDVRRQRCWFHKMQNVASRVRKADQLSVLKGLRKVYDAANRKAAERAYARWARKWKGRYSKAVECVDKDLEWLLNIYTLPEAHRKRVRTTNPIERCFREVRRRTRSIGTFVNDDSIERIIYGLISYMNRKFAEQPCAGFRRKSRAA